MTAIARLAVATVILLLPLTGSAQVVIGAGGHVAPRAAPATAAALVSEIPCPDPSAFHDGVDWYIFGTGGGFFLQGKTLVPDEMHRVALHLDHAGFTPRVANIWRFTVYRHCDGTYHAYGTLHLGRFRTVIGHFAPKAGEAWSPGRPITGWKLDAVLVGDPRARTGTPTIRGSSPTTTGPCT